MLETLARDLTNFLHANPHWGSIITFIIAFAESLAIVGTIIPGSVTMTAVGVMVGTGVLPLTTTYLVATLGALVGDYVSYWVGKYYGDNIRTIKFLSKNNHWVEKGEEFFEQHGGKSVIIGRFFGPVRSLIPLIAGLLKMPTIRFTIAIIPAAILWAVVYMTPGVLLGAVSLELPPAAATKLLMYGFAIVLGAWLLSQGIKLFFSQVWYWCDQCVLNVWQKMRQKKSTRWFTTLLAEPIDPDNHQQLTLLFMMMITSILFICIAISVYENVGLTILNDPIYHLLTSIRTPTLDRIMIGITILAERKVLLALGLIVQTYLLWQKKYRAATHWFLLMVFGVGATLGVKHLHYNPRPNVLLTGLSSSSFPSGHVSLMTLLLGFSAVLISHELPIDFKKVPYRITAIVISLIAFSRLYLGAHWLTDVIAAFLLAITVILAITISYRRHLIQHIAPLQLASVIIISWLSIAFVYGIKHYSRLDHNYQVPGKTFHISAKSWWKDNDIPVPLYRDNRFGKPTQILNIQWLGDIRQIQQQLLTHRWEYIPPNTTIKNILKRAAIQSNGYRLSLMPQQYDYQVPSLLMMKNNIVLRLWASNILIIDSKQELWLGSASPMIHKGKKVPQITDVNKIKSMLSTPEVKIKIQNLPENTTFPKSLAPIDQIVKITERTHHE